MRVEVRLPQVFNTMDERVAALIVQACLKNGS